MTTKLSRISKKNVVLIFVIPLVVLLAFLAIVFVIYMFLGSDTSKSKKGTHHYRHFQLNPETKDTYRGLISLFEPLEEEQFLSYEDYNGNYNLISQFDGTEEYHCTGSCFCANSEERRSLAQPLVQGLTYLVAAVSSVTAIKLAKDRFSEMCEKALENECDKVNIRSQLHDCDDAVEDNEGEVPEYDEYGDRRLPKLRWMCTGHCLDMDPTEYLFREDLEKQYEEGIRNAECEKLTLTKEVLGDGELEANRVFLLAEDGLIKFCKSHTINLQVGERGKGGQPIRYDMELCKAVSDCTANNPTIQCRKI